MAFHLEIKPDSVEEGADKGGIWQARELILQKAVDEPRAHEKERNVTQRSHEPPNSLERTCCDKNKQKTPWAIMKGRYIMSSSCLHSSLKCSLLLPITPNHYPTIE